jgi:hypothetical protein
MRVVGYLSNGENRVWLYFIRMAASIRYNVAPVRAPQL